LHWRLLHRLRYYYQRKEVLDSMKKSAMLMTSKALSLVAAVLLVSFKGVIGTPKSDDVV
jgi:hypothetical protein